MLFKNVWKTNSSIRFKCQIFKDMLMYIKQDAMQGMNWKVWKWNQNLLVMWVQHVFSEALLSNNTIKLQQNISSFCNQTHNQWDKFHSIDKSGWMKFKLEAVYTKAQLELSRYEFQI